jgi:hypothetical protein
MEDGLAENWEPVVVQRKRQKNAQVEVTVTTWAKIRWIEAQPCFKSVGDRDLA